MALGDGDAGAAAPAAGGPGGPRPPVAVDGRRPLPHGHTLPRRAPLPEETHPAVSSYQGPDTQTIAMVKRREALHYGPTLNIEL